MSRYCGDRNPEPLIAAAAHWRRVALLGDGSVFSEGLLWTEENVATLVREFVDKPDEGEDRFLDKLKRQLEPATSAAKQLAAEIQWLLWLAPSNVKASTKIDEVREIWSWSGEPVPDSEWLDATRLVGVGSGGRGFMNYRWRELVFVIRILEAFKKLPLPNREQPLANGWTLAEWLERIPECEQRQFRHMLLYMLFPDDFERIFSAGDREEILKRFTGKRSSQVRSLSAIQIDRELLAIRDKQSELFPGVPLDFYNPPLDALWRETESNVWLLAWNPENYLWDTFAKDREATHRGEAVKERWTCVNSAAKPGDLAYLVRTGREPRGVIAVGNVLSEPYRDPHWDPVKAASGETRQCIDVEFTRIQDPTNGDGYVSAEALKSISSEQQWAPQGSGIEIKRNAAAALAKLWKENVETKKVLRVEPPGALQIPQNIIYYGPPGTGKTHKIAQLRASYTSEASTQSREAWLSGELAEVPWFDVIVAVLWDLGTPTKVGAIVQHPFFIGKAQAVGRKQNLTNHAWSVLQSHTRASSETVQTKYRSDPLVFDKNDRAEWALVDDWTEQCGEQIAQAKRWKAGPAQISAMRRFEFVTFHQSYGYEDFVEGIRPRTNENTGEVSYEVVPGVFRRLCQRASVDPENRYALFIDEINRGNIAKILGELITLVEPDKRAVHDSNGALVSGLEVTLPYSGDRFGVPPNLDIYGTMNTADRSIALLDTALRRRFRFVELMPNPGLISGSDGHGRIEDGSGGLIDLRRMLTVINQRLVLLLNRDMQVGHAYLMSVRDFVSLRDVVLTQVVPLLQEYFYEDWRRIQLVLADIADNDQANPPQIVAHEAISPNTVFGSERSDMEPSVSYRVVATDDLTPEAFRKIYEPAS